MDDFEITEALAVEALPLNKWCSYTEGHTQQLSCTGSQ